MSRYFDQLEEAICEQDLESDGLVNVVRAKDPSSPNAITRITISTVAAAAAAIASFISQHILYGVVE